MTAPDLPTWTVADDADGDLTLWYGDLAVLRAIDIKASGGHRNALFAVLTSVLAPDEATIDRLARVLHAIEPDSLDWDEDLSPDWRDRYRFDVRKLFAALAGTSAQARHTAEATGGGEG